MLEKFTKSIKKISDLTKTLTTSITSNIKYRRKEKEIKIAILGRFKTKQIDKIARRKKISFKWEDPLTGERQVAKTKNQKIKRLASKLSLKEVVELARSYKVKHKDLLEELDRFKAKLEADKRA